ncbi:hypothetical protein E3P92_01568 [Wallemia ichthyophaga]|uniref:Uncharacterized protein n=2 Tax=Wallemia ichthyophaga TaxID=245174 RepID=A0A4T0HKI0_WALIC|nr:uncharacterized protein J056_004191 [Wallemia ichthyophaga EXF-994]TIA73604.1 hypothetical protein E3P91_01405 [Wallemia ichthyophaga]EOR01405.1 hypothetical protein J056_004191 [Wallemia ichthyophaga EXF-994]TIA82433.1 hypothetical protein E3P98_01426 [Wallemia ichthyophaga]TIA91913.1 hypothetical protein E3P97_01806 [Wallemia ichthyophaga]TIB00948.1 hypothetical protein E3P95_01521 [Wallemia ichthyophaga]
MTLAAQSLSTASPQSPIAHRRPSATDTAAQSKLQLNPQPVERTPREHLQRRKSATVLESYLV